ncbi:MAG: Gfo/Idh/MocA family oxidoreductase [Verrucomicrobiae bacterium]|nr:Gfo/Idh/MocA family oxidoreductase [Verrucomicrobiae bacterium]
MKSVRLGIIGLGMGGVHARYLLDGKVNRCELTAVCDMDPNRLAKYNNLRTFRDAGEMFNSGTIDAVLIATPHYSHTTLGISALKKGLHVLVEKPISVHKADCEKLLEAHRGKKQVFAAMFNLRCTSIYKKIRHLVTSGELGEIRRVNWIITNWFRTEAYYASGGWRATWGGEGGGVLLNQCPHNLDLFQWMFGMPDRVRGFCQFGRYHKIEVEDDVTAYFEYKDGKTGVFVASTGEAPGTNRLEVTGEKGRLVFENNKILFTRNEAPMTEFSRTTDQGFAMPPVWEVAIPVPADTGAGHQELTQNFVDAILDGAPLVAPAKDGMRSVELANAILLSTFENKTIDLPMNSAQYERHLKRLIAASKFKKKEVKPAVNDLSKSFNK